MGKIYNTKKKNILYLCRYCNRHIMKNGFRSHHGGKQHQENLKKYGDKPPIEDSTPIQLKKIKNVKSHYKSLMTFIGEVN